MTYLVLALAILSEGISKSQITAAPANISTTNSTIPNEDGGSQPADKVLIAVAILVGAVLIGAVVAKIVDIIHDRKSVGDNASDMSDYTRDMLKKRYAIMAFKSNLDTTKSKSDRAALKVGRHWSEKATAKRLKRSQSKVEEDKQVITSDVESANLNNELTRKTQDTGHINGGFSLSEVASTECETTKAGDSVNNNVQGVNDKLRIPSLTIDDMEDEVFHTDQNESKTVRSSTGSDLASQQNSSTNVTKLTDVELTANSSGATPASEGRATPKPDAWLSSNGIQKSDNKEKEEEDQSKTNVTEQQQNDGERTKKKKQLLEEELDIPQRPSNPTPPQSTPPPTITIAKLDDSGWDEGIIYSYDETAKTPKVHNKKGTAENNSAKNINTKPKVFTLTQKPVNRPQTSRPTTARSTRKDTGSTRPKTAVVGAVRTTGNRPLSSKPNHKIAPGVRLKSAKK